MTLAHIYPFSQIKLTSWPWGFFFNQASVDVCILISAANLTYVRIRLVRIKSLRFESVCLQGYLRSLVSSFVSAALLCHNSSSTYVSSVQWEVCVTWVILMLIPPIQAYPRERRERCQRVICHGTYIIVQRGPDECQIGRAGSGRSKRLSGKVSARWIK